MTALHEITNAAFLAAIFPGLNPDERIWFNAAPGNPNNATFKWKGETGLPEHVQDYLHGNAYFSVATFKANATGRLGNFFSRLPVVVLDDPERVELAPSWVTRTSEHKRQVGFILSEPIADRGIAQRLATALAENGLVPVDTSGNNWVRYVRLPKGHNGKYSPPYPCQLEGFNPERTFTLDELIDTLKLVRDSIMNKVDAKPASNGGDTYKRKDWAELLGKIARSDSYHTPINELTASMAQSGLTERAIVAFVQEFMLATSDGTERWKARFDDIIRSTRGAIEKFAPKVAAWPEMADPFAENPAPPFPLDTLPRVFRAYIEGRAGQSGFDPGGYAFSMLVATGNMLDHRWRLEVSPEFRIPPMLWGGLTDASGGGKSPIISASKTEPERINEVMVRDSARAMAQWQDSCVGLKREDWPRKPAWRQRHALDTTIEALGDLLKDNPEGINIFADELTEWIGRQDAYSAGGGKDRGTYLRAFDGGSMTINRKTGHMHVENFSVGVLAGIQPEKLADLFKKSAAGGADGLYQRFLLYALRPPGLVDYSVTMGTFDKTNLGMVYDRIHAWNESNKPQIVRMDMAARRDMQAYHNASRILAERTSAPRFKEHLNKFPGFIGRVALALHVMESASAGDAVLRPELSAETFARAKRIMTCMYRHSEAIYAILDAKAGDVLTLARSAAEAVLTRAWQRFQRGDLTRYATHWQGAAEGAAEGALDLLIELGWIADITPATLPGKRGRKSEGVFAVNPDAHVTFSAHAERVKQARAERYSALKALAECRVN